MEPPAAVPADPAPAAPLIQPPMSGPFGAMSPTSPRGKPAKHLDETKVDFGRGRTSRKVTVRRGHRSREKRSHQLSAALADTSTGDLRGRGVHGDARDKHAR